MPTTFATETSSLNREKVDEIKEVIKSTHLTREEKRKKMASNDAIDGSHEEVLKTI